jgi:hypothetical protein
MGLFDAPTSNTAQGVNDIPAPRSDATVNAPPADQHKRVIDFVRLSLLDDGWLSVLFTSPFPHGLGMLGGRNKMYKALRFFPFEGYWS